MNHALLLNTRRRGGDVISQLYAQSLLTDAWESGARMFQVSDGTSPVTAEDQTVAAWDGRYGTRLTTTGGAMKAKLINGRLTPVSISDLESTWVVPGGVSINQRDFTAWLHCQCGSGYYGGYFGFGADRGCELYNLDRVKYQTFNATGGARSCALNSLASPHVLGVEGTASGLTAYRNAASGALDPALPAGSVTGGFIGSLNGAGSALIPSTFVWHGIAVTKTLSSQQKTDLRSYFDARVSRPSDTVPALNICFMGDSNSAGTGAGGVSAQWYFAANGARVVTSTKSATYFSAGVAPQNSAGNLADIATDFLAGAGRNIVVFMDTNDFSSASAADALSARETAAATLQGSGFEVWQPYMPIRVAPYGAAAAYKTVVEAFNTLLASSSSFDERPDLYTAFGGASPPAGTFASDGIHFTAATQLLVYNTLNGTL